MVTDAIRHGLDQHRLLLGEYELSCLLRGSVDGENVVSVDAQRPHPICHSSHRDAVASILVIDRRADRVHVVTTEEERLAAEGRRKVQRRMKVAL